VFKNKRYSNDIERLTMMKKTHFTTATTAQHKNTNFLLNKLQGVRVKSETGEANTNFGFDSKIACNQTSGKEAVCTSIYIYKAIEKNQ
jgi:hypothetical protein